MILVGLVGLVGCSIVYIGYSIKERFEGRHKW